MRCTMQMQMHTTAQLCLTLTLSHPHAVAHALCAERLLLQFQVHFKGAWVCAAADASSVPVCALPDVLYGVPASPLCSGPND